MNASVAIVIVGDEENTSLSWTTDFPPVLLADKISVSDNQPDKCNNFGRVAICGNRNPLHTVIGGYFTAPHRNPISNPSSHTGTL